MIKKRSNVNAFCLRLKVQRTSRTSPSVHRCIQTNIAANNLGSIPFPAAKCQSPFISNNSIMTYEKVKMSSFVFLPHK